MSAAAGRLDGKTALVTGAAKRIGREIALALAARGANVCITYKDSAGEAEETIGDLRAAGVTAHAFRCDLADASAIREMARQVLDRVGTLDILVNNAGVFAASPMEDITAAAWDAMFAVNTRAPFLVAQQLLTALRERRGRIINIGSLGGVHAWETHAHYCTSKAALHMLSQTMAKAWAPEVSVNCVAPGMIEMGEIGSMYERFAQKTPMQRNGRATDVAEAVLFFATAPTFITGQLLVVDGGLGL